MQQNMEKIVCSWSNLRWGKKENVLRNKRWNYIKKRQMCSLSVYFFMWGAFDWPCGLALASAGD